MERWKPPVELSRQEQMLMKRLVRVRALFGFLRTHRHELFDDEFQGLLESMYRTTGAGDPPNKPAQMCMAVLLQGYVGASDAEAVELTLVDLRWQMVLDCVGAVEPPFSQGSLQAFRERMIEHQMDRALLEKTAELVRAGAASNGDSQMIGKAIKVAIDSRPLAGAGRVEDTINLLGHAARSIVRIVSKITDRNPRRSVTTRAFRCCLRRASKPGSTSTGATRRKAIGIEIVERQVSSLQRWIDRHLEEVINEPLRPYIEAIAQVRTQDLETAADGAVRIRQGVAPDRRISIEDTQMRHGRKSRSKRFDGYKEHIARDLELPLIAACAVTPANRPEEEGAAPIGEDIALQGLRLIELHIDRAYVNSPLVTDVVKSGGRVFAKPWGVHARAPGMFTKHDFKIDLRAQTVSCPAGQVEPFEPGDTVEFDPEVCGACALRSKCTQAASGRGRTISIAADEAMQKKFRVLQKTRTGRCTLRRRTAVEHALAHIAARKGQRARYVGVRKNLFDLRRAAAIQNLEAVQRQLMMAA